jgi:amidohydrolase
MHAPSRLAHSFTLGAFLMDRKKKLCAYVDSLAADLVEVSTFIHRNPESGYQEFKASALLMERLRKHGFSVEQPLEKMPTAFKARYGSSLGRPAIGFMAEYDALPEIGHGCGHNLIAASAYGAALALVPSIREFGGSVWLFGTPAEEYDGGKIPMLEEGIFDSLDAAMMMHPECLYMVNTSALAMDALHFHFLGKAAHASATPHEGINALDAVIQLFNGINALRQHLRPEARVHGIITRGGNYPNIIPDHTEAKIYVRAPERAYLDGVTRKVKNCARGAAKATGCRLKISSFERSFDNIRNNPVIARLVHDNLSWLGVEEIAPFDMEPGSTDFGNVSQKIPSVYIYAATAPKGSSLHTKEFAKLSLAPMAHEALIISVKAMALTALNLLENPALVKELR